MLGVRLLRRGDEAGVAAFTPTKEPATNPRPTAMASSCLFMTDASSAWRK